ncbi:MAG: alpha/beta hydrolase [Chitinophagaceae bacterium]|nr:alpha/beta hydrolase [Chitinophagaceae bacterium]MCW5927209.1 alpha/beta hydrolase [Chitinophagaceae bacterium]
MNRKDLTFVYLSIIFTLARAVCHGQTPVADDYAASLATKLEPTRKIAYKKVKERNLYLHLFAPDGFEQSNRRACFIAFHGGGWVKGEPRRFYPIVDEFVKRGMVGISAEYRFMDTSDGTTVFDCVRDGRSVVRYVRQHAKELGVDPQKIVVSGGSAGAHVAVGTALFDAVNEVTDFLDVSTMPDALVLYYPVIDTSPEGYGANRIGEQWITLSPLHNVKKGLPPTILFHGTSDKVTPFKGAKNFQDTMIKAGNKCHLIIKEGGIHGYMMFEKNFYDEAISQTITFLKSCGII